MSLKEASVGRIDVFKIPVEKLTIVPGRNVRMDFGDEDTLARQIAEVGQLVPVTVRQEGDKVEIVDGERRLRAIKTANKKYNAKIESVKCVAEDRYANEEDRIITMLQANEGKPLEALEKAEAFKRLVAFGWTKNQIAAKMGTSATAVSTILDLNSAPAPIRKAVREHKMSATAGAKAAKAKPEKQKEIVEKVEAGKKVGVKDTVAKRTQFSLTEVVAMVENAQIGSCHDCPIKKDLVAALRAGAA